MRVGGRYTAALDTRMVGTQSRMDAPHARLLTPMRVGRSKCWRRSTRMATNTSLQVCARCVLPAYALLGTELACVLPPTCARYAVPGMLLYSSVRTMIGAVKYSMVVRTWYAMPGSEIHKAIRTCYEMSGSEI
eukprot:3359064-Rhodomonas_salina.2